MDPLDRLGNATGFQWDEGNLEKSVRKHHVEFWESEEAFFNEPFIVLPDEAHSNDEERFYGLGRTDSGRHLFIVFTFRGDEIRVISARDMSRKERSAYGSYEAKDEDPTVSD